MWSIQMPLNAPITCSFAYRGGQLTNWPNLDTSLGAVSHIKDYVIETPGEEHSGYSLQEFWETSVYALKLKQRLICARTGSGKSSLLSVLVRLIELDNSLVEIDDLNISQVNLDRLRKAIIAVPQDAPFMAGSIRFNLNQYDDGDLDDNALQSIIRDIRLEKLVADHGGLEEEIRPEWFSIGQAQLFCLARAML
ncbi:P-loop containing nucleoside triphosphate hydrolase protein [Xylaria cf. heliscus]|nr:P-loop containing nucleoside triphosphate hydrolase protein [Xylaria cf. heliscus]